MENPWDSLAACTATSPSADVWLRDMLARNGNCDYLRQFNGPTSLEDFRAQVPICSYVDIEPYLRHICNGASNVLFAGRPIAYERTGGSSSGPKLIPYSATGLLDFQNCIVPWLAGTVARHGISGTAYFSISPATRAPENINGVPVGLPDGAYLGDTAAYALASRTAVPFEVGQITNLDEWRTATLRHLAAAADLELISVWSPTFLLRLLDHIPDPVSLWPNLKVISCWASGLSKRHADEIRQRLPHAYLQPKGLLSTEAVITVPDEQGLPVLARHGFVEFSQGDALLLEDQLEIGANYAIVVTTASGLYRYRTGDIVVFRGRNPAGLAVLEFTSRDSLTSDLVGEKLTEEFVAACLSDAKGFTLLIPNAERPGYTLICSRQPAFDLDARLHRNPQYAYARKLGQLAPLEILAHPAAESEYQHHLLSNGTRLGDIKLLVLRKETFWLPYFKERFA
jgi:hypothetical protein